MKRQRKTSEPKPPTPKERQSHYRGAGVHKHKLPKLGQPDTAYKSEKERRKAGEPKTPRSDVLRRYHS